MTALTALALLAAVALLLLYPESGAAMTLRTSTARHPRLVIGVSILLAIVISIGGFWPSRGDREVGADEYAELWHMVETAPQMREPARARLSDGRLTRHELSELRVAYREAPDVDTMRSGVVKELSR